MAKLIIFDKAKWHYGGDFPPGLGEEQGFVHTGMFLGWVIDAGLYSDEFADELAEEIKKFKARKLTGPGVYRALDGAFDSDMLNPEGLAFTRAYFDFDKGKYLGDYAKLLSARLPTLYHVRDTWENYGRLKPQIDKRYAAWQRRKPKRKPKAKSKRRSR